MSKFIIKSLMMIAAVIISSDLHSQSGVKQVTLTQAGSLLSAIGGDTLFAKAMQKIKITGPINGSDIILIHAMQKMTYLDLQDADIQSSSDIYYMSVDGVKYATANHLIGGYMFYNMSKLQTVMLPSSTSSIGPYAFCGCSGITSIVIPESVTSIGTHAFSFCKALASMSMGNEVKDIGKAAFSGCSALTSAILSDAVTAVNDDVFFGCTSLSSVILPDALTSIGRWAFACCSEIDSVTLPTSTTSIGDYAFCGCKRLLSIDIPNEVSVIGTSVLSLCNSLSSVSISSSITSIPENMFSSCSSLSEIAIPLNIKSIGQNAFCDCDGITSLNIPASITSIGNWAFWNCINISNFYCFCSTPPSCSSNTFNCNTSLYVPYGYKNSYDSVEPWTLFADIIEFYPSCINNFEKPHYTNVYNKDKTIIIDNMSTNIEIANIYTVDGSNVTTKVIKEGVNFIPVDKSGIYIVKIATKSLKTLVR